MEVKHYELFSETEILDFYQKKITLIMIHFSKL